MKRGILYSWLLAAALLSNASVRLMVPQGVVETRPDHGELIVNSEKPMEENTINYSLFTIHSAAAVAPYPRVAALLPVVRQADIKDEDQRLADQVFRAMIPARCIGDLKNFYVVYTGLQSRGFAGKDSIIIDGTVKSTNEKIGLLVHEATHFLDLSGCITGTPESGISAFKDGDDLIYKDDPSVEFYSISWATANVQKKGTAAADFATGYARSANCYEDVAESVAYYVLHPDDFRARAKKNTAMAKKLAWIEAYVFPNGRILAKQEGAKFTGKIPWDATKLAFTWQGNRVIAAR